jgi:hypothetical protein
MSGVPLDSRNNAAYDCVMEPRKIFALVTTVLCIALANFIALANGGQASLLLPSPLQVSGVVVDATGNPIADALVENTDENRKSIKSDAQGEFALITRAPSFVIRKPGFQSVFLRSMNSSSVRVTMETSKEVLPSCAAQSACKTIDGWQSAFCFPVIPEVKVSEVGRDIDYGQRLFTVKTKSGVKGIRHGAGPLWSVGIPTNEDVWSSVKYSEKTFLAGHSFIVDARGNTAADKYWRSVGTFGESATYYDVDQDTADLLNRVMDGICIRPPNH